jgi:hypothetical protein
MNGQQIIQNKTYFYLSLNGLFHITVTNLFVWIIIASFGDHKLAHSQGNLTRVTRVKLLYGGWGTELLRDQTLAVVDVFIYSWMKYISKLLH